MGWYLFILALLLVITVIDLVCKKKGINVTKVSFLASIFVIFFFMALRNNTVGADTRTYCNIYSLSANDAVFTYVSPFFSLVNVYGRKIEVETGYLLFNRLFRLLFSGSQTIIVLTSLIIVILLYKLIKFSSPLPLLSIWLYITLGIFQTEMNMSRNAVGILLCYFAISHCITRKQLVKYMFIVVLASTFHFTSIIFFPMYWLATAVVWNRKKLLMIASTVGFFTFFSHILGPYIIRLIPAQYVYYFAESATHENLLLGVFYFLLFLLCMFFVDYGEKLSTMNRCRVGVMMLFMNMIGFSFGYSFSFAGRVAALFGPYIVVLLPQLIASGIKSIKIRRFAIFSVYIITGAQYIFRLSFNNIGLTMPYSFFFT